MTLQYYRIQISEGNKGDEEKIRNTLLKITCTTAEVT